MKHTLLLLLFCFLTHTSENNLVNSKKNQKKLAQLHDPSKADSGINLTDCEIIEKLDLRKKNLSHLSPVISRFENLRVLYADNNTLTKLPSEISSLVQLVGLRLDNNQLSELPNLQALSNLEFASFSGNNLTTLETSDGNLVFPKQLKLLNLERNKLRLLPATINTLTELRNLNVSHNSLNKLPDELGQCFNLYELNISHNQLSQLPITITQLTKLDSLTFTNNQSNFLQNSAQNMQVATWISTPLIKEIFIKAQNIKNEREYCSLLEQLPSELVEKIITSLSCGTQIIQDIQAIINLSATNKVIKNKIKHSLDALKKKLAQHYNICPALITWYFKKNNYGAIKKACRKFNPNELYILLQDAQRIYVMLKKNKHSETINSYLMDAIAENDKILCQEVNKHIDRLFNIAWRYRDGSALLLREGTPKNDLVFYHVLDENRYVSDNCLVNTISESGNVNSRRKNHPALSRHMNNNNNEFAQMQLTPLRFPGNKNERRDKCGGKIPFCPHT